MSGDLIASLSIAVAAAPDDVTLRLHLAEVLLEAGRADEAVPHIAEVLAREGTSGAARALMVRAMSAAGTDPVQADDDPPPRAPGFDWQQAESQVSDVAPPMFVDGSTAEDPGPAYTVADAGIRLADVGGMEEVKKRLEASFLAPLRNPELRRLYGKSLRGGLLLYGPPGCGKTFLARALAGEMGASFLAVSLADVLDMYIGNSEKNVHELFEQARASAPCVLFLDELDALGQKRTLTRHSGMRGTVNQLLTELDGVSGTNEGVYVLAASNHPWDVDPAILRPGRVDRMLLVLPPDQAARESILRYHLRERPVAGIDLRRLAKQSEGYSGADLAHVCDSAAEFALLDSVASGTPRMIDMRDLERALNETRSSVGPWLQTARNVALYANQSGEYDELAKYIRRHTKG